MLGDFSVRWYLNTEKEILVLPDGEVIVPRDCACRVFKLFWASQSFKGRLFHMRKITCTSTLALVSQPAFFQLSLVQSRTSSTYQQFSFPFHHLQVCTVLYYVPNAALQYLNVANRVWVWFCFVWKLQALHWSVPASQLRKNWPWLIRRDTVLFRVWYFVSILTSLLGNCRPFFFFFFG